MKNLTDLAEPFHPKDIEWRVQTVTQNRDKVLVLPYLTNRAVMERLDKVLGAENWANEYREIDGGMLCGLSLRINNEWITKWDGAEKMHDTDFDVKGPLSNSMKRTAVQWGIGRYLYELPAYYPLILPQYEGTNNFYIKKGEMRGSFNDPQLPADALPKDFSYNDKPSSPTAVLTKKSETTNAQTGGIASTETPQQIAIRQITDLENWLGKSGRLKSTDIPNLRKKYTGVANLSTAPIAKLADYKAVLVKQKAEAEAEAALNLLNAGAPTVQANAD